MLNAHHDAESNLHHVMVLMAYPVIKNLIKFKCKTNLYFKQWSSLYASVHIERRPKNCH